MKKTQQRLLKSESNRVHAVFVLWWVGWWVGWGGEPDHTVPFVTPGHCQDT